MLTCEVWGKINSERIIVLNPKDGTELQKAAEAYYRQQVIPYYGWRILFLVHDYNEIHAIRPAYQARKMTQRIDSTLYHNGCFCAPQYDTYEP